MYLIEQASFNSQIRTENMFSCFYFISLLTIIKRKSVFAYIHIQKSKRENGRGGRKFTGFFCQWIQR